MTFDPADLIRILSISEPSNGDLVGITASASDLDTTNNTVTYTLTDDGRVMRTGVVGYELDY